ncbi:hypothetical protein [Paenibacillus odorifer]|jgi:hypothetical protein|uniref:hypothetical protein n=1 Tax=Paenibacillus odorifer TaxID=189426 RepID=UPI0015C3FF9C|nr:hypothetical protein [Paenibacillus odorifer]
MTLVNPDYCREIISKLIDGGIELYHFSLCASRETLLKRLSIRVKEKTLGLLSRSTGASEGLITRYLSSI